jgi:hypothetical protein
LGNLRPSIRPCSNTSHRSAGSMSALRETIYGTPVSEWPKADSARSGLPEPAVLLGHDCSPPGPRTGNGRTRSTQGTNSA